MNRIDRLTAIIIFLQGRHRVTVDELAEKYNVSNRTIYRDLRALQEVGVPIGSEQGEGYFIVKGYHLPPVMFDKDEAAALLAGERLMRKWSETNLSESYLSALDKIRAVLHSREKEYLNTLDQHIKVSPWPDETQAEFDHRILGFLQDVIVHRKVISIEYYSPYKDQYTQRDVEPLGLLLRSNHWYLAAWCCLRADYRMFRVERIENYHKTGKQLSDPPEHTLKEFSEESLNQEQDLQEIEVEFSKEIVRYVGDQKYYHGWVSEEQLEDGVVMTFLTASSEYFARWLLIWGAGVEIKKPRTLRERVQELSKELHLHHNST